MIGVWEEATIGHSGVSLGILRTSFFVGVLPTQQPWGVNYKIKI
jgi:hypothetical protein